MWRLERLFEFLPGEAFAENGAADITADVQHVRLLELGQHVVGLSAHGVVDGAAVPLSFFGIVAQTADQHDLVGGFGAQGGIRIVGVEAAFAVGVVGVFEPDDAGLVGVAVGVDAYFGAFMGRFADHLVYAEDAVARRIGGAEAETAAEQQERQEKDAFHGIGFSVSAVRRAVRRISS